MIKKPTLFRIEEIVLPNNKVILTFVNKVDFLKWVGDGGVYVTDKPDADGVYTFYTFGDDFLAIIFKQKGDKL